MTLLRPVLAAALLAILVGLPALVTQGSPLVDVAVVNAAPADGPRHPEKEKKDKENDGIENGNGNGNGNGNNNGNGNDNNSNDDSNSNGNDNGHDGGGRENSSSAPPPQPSSPTGRCFSAGQSGALSLTLDGGTVTLTVVSGSPFPRASRVTLARVDSASVPTPPGPRLDEIVFEVQAQDGCDGNALGDLAADANLGVGYHVPADTSSLRFAVLDGARWVDVPTVPDPNPGNAYVSATAHRTGTYVLYQAR